ncbi:MAG: hypothetical protein COB02_00440 [Candidatus Cloacimonadota bacterium]|nr:MAG: hypothetical protein COB02_00440 [Candidatus Cloacimonadota bacterium]
MKLAIYAPYDYSKIGGVERYVLSFLQACPNDIETVLISDNIPSEATFRVISTNEIEKENFDLCISHAIHGGALLPKAKKYIHIFHGTILGNLFVRPWLWLHPKFWSWLLMEYKSIKQKDGIIAVSNWASSETRKMGFKGPIEIIPSGGGFLNDKFCSEKKFSPTFIFCGRFSDKVKRFSMILDAFRIAKLANPKIELYVLGGDLPFKEEGIISLGALPWDEVKEVYKKCCFQINASYYEGCSLSMAEGVFLGNTINLASSVGGNLDQLLDETTGYFFKDTQELATHMILASLDEDKFEKMQKNLSESEIIPSWEDVVSKTLNFYHSLI